MSLVTGSRIGGYTIVSPLGAGGMGEVYRAHDPHLDREVALKIIAGDFGNNPTWRERFRREARLLATLSHPNVATVYAVAESDGVLALAMELVEGETLTHHLRPGGMPIERLLKIGVQIADALSAAHQQGITHRDLKPANVMVSGDGRVKVLDFGVARLAPVAPDSGDQTTAARSQLTAEGHLIGTPVYMSPEQAEGRPLDHRSDIFSFGTLLYEMSTGELPFHGQSVLSLLTAIVRDTPPPPAEINSAMPRQLSKVIRRCLAKDLEERYQSAKDLRNDLSELRQELSSGEIAPVAVGRPARRWRRGALAVVAALALAAAAWSTARLAGPRSTGIRPLTVSQVTFGAGVASAPSLSPDGRWVVYAKREASRSDIYLQAIGADNGINLTRQFDGDSDSPAFSYDGESIAFRSQAQGGGLFVMGRTGELARRVADGGYYPAWSPDGRELAFTTGAAGDAPNAHPGGSELWVVNVETGQKRRLDVLDALQPAWSPNGLRIAYWAVEPASHQRDLWTVAADGSGAVRLTNDPANDVSPAWSADGAYLHFASDRGGTLNLWRLRISSGAAAAEPEPVSVPAVSAAHPSLSADGRHLAYAVLTRSSQVMQVGFDPATATMSGEPQAILGGAQDWSAARVAPAGELIALVRWGWRQDLYTVQPNGTNLRRLTNDTMGVRCPEWSPDGTRLAYMRNLQTEGAIILIDVVGGRTERVPTGALEGLGCPGWSPDGRRLVIAQAPPHGNAYIFTIGDQGAGASPVQLPAPGEHRFVPRAWSRNGRYIAGTIRSRIAVYDLEQRSYRLLTEEGAAAFASFTHWLPDDRRLMFMGPSGNSLSVVDQSGRLTQALAVSPPQAIRGGSITRDGRRLVYSLGEEDGQLWVATLPQEN